MQPLWNPTQPHSEQRQLIPLRSRFFFRPRVFWKNYLLGITLGATVDSSRYESRFPDTLRGVTTTSCNAATLKRLERSEAVERLERLERLIDPGGFVLAGIEPVWSRK
jgi:hypothetical protein